MEGMWVRRRLSCVSFCGDRAVSYFGFCTGCIPMYSLAFTGVVSPSSRRNIATNPTKISERRHA